jgi:hypothetical protein
VLLHNRAAIRYLLATPAVLASRQTHPPIGRHRLPARFGFCDSDKTITLALCFLNQVADFCARKPQPLQMFRVPCSMNPRFNGSALRRPESRHTPNLIRIAGLQARDTPFDCASRTRAERAVKSLVLRSRCARLERADACRTTQPAIPVGVSTVDVRCRSAAGQDRPQALRLHSARGAASLGTPCDGAGRAMQHPS